MEIVGDVTYAANVSNPKPLTIDKVYSILILISKLKAGVVDQKADW